MRRRDFSFTLALCASLVVHGWFIAAGLRSFARNNLTRLGDDFARPMLLVAVNDDDELGARDGTGDAIDEASGETLLQARQAEQTQILGSLDPVGAGQFRDRPSMSVLPTGGALVRPRQEAADPQPTIGVPTPPTPSIPEGFGHRKPTQAPESPPQEARKTDAPPAESSAAPPPPQSAVASVPGVPMPSADPAPQAQTESDPVSVQGGAYFRNGRALVQFGRKHKLTAPRLTLAARTDLMQMPSPTIVVLKIRLDRTGTVTNVEIFKSSGSNDIDQTCRVEAYNWWLEPKRDNDNQPVDDEFLFTLRFS